MNCDQVFDVLTRGPFPSGVPIDGDVELHLEVCHECRQLVDALRPAIGLFHESVPHDECDDLPGYRGSLPESETRSLPSAVAMMLDQPSVGTRPTCEPRRSITSDMASWRVAAVCLLVLAMVGLVWTVSSTSDSGLVFTSSGALSLEQVQFQPDAGGLLHLGKLKLSDACTQEFGREQLEATTSTGDSIDRDSQTQRYICCTQCHHAASSSSASAPPHAISIAMAACIACHQ